MLRLLSFLLPCLPGSCTRLGLHLPWQVAGQVFIWEGRSRPLYIEQLQAAIEAVQPDLFISPCVVHLTPTVGWGHRTM